MLLNILGLLSVTEHTWVIQCYRTHLDYSVLLNILGLFSVTEHTWVIQCYRTYLGYSVLMNLVVTYLSY